MYLLQQRVVRVAVGDVEHEQAALQRVQPLAQHHDADLEGD